MTERTLVFDLEGDGLYDEITQIWCICTKEVETGELRWFYNEGIGQVRHTGNIGNGFDYLNTADTLIGHNIINYDLRVFNNCAGSSDCTSAEPIRKQL